MEFEFEFENTSGQGKEAIIPEGIRGWNWGGFFLNWVWGIGNSTFIALLMFVPLVNFVMPFVLGAKGNKWAWQNRTWRSVEQFKKTQRKWSIAGVLIVFIPLLSLVFLTISSMKQSEVYKLSFHELQMNQEVIELLGEPLESGVFVTGQIKTGPGTGEAKISYSMSGPKGKATSYVYAVKKFGEWKLHQLVIHAEDPNKRIDVIDTY